MKNKIQSLSNEKSFEEIIKLIINNKPFSFVRFGDADYLMMLRENIGKELGSNNKFVVTNSLLEELIETHSIYDERFLIGTVLNDELDNKLYCYKQFIRNHNRIIQNLPIKKTNLLSAVTLTETFINKIDKFIEFIDLLKNKSTMFIGSYYHENLGYLYGNIKYNILTPITNSYIKIDDIYN